MSCCSWWKRPTSCVYKSQRRCHSSQECFNSPYGTQYFIDYAEPIPGTTSLQCCQGVQKYTSLEMRNWYSEFCSSSEYHMTARSLIAFLRQLSTLNLHLSSSTLIFAWSRFNFYLPSQIHLYKLPLSTFGMTFCAHELVLFPPPQPLMSSMLYVVVCVYWLMSSSNVIVVSRFHSRMGYGQTLQHLHCF